MADQLPRQPWFKGTVTNKWVVTTISRLRANHTVCGSYLHRINKKVLSPLCVDCNEEKDFKHIIMICPRYVVERKRMFHDLYSLCNVSSHFVPLLGRELKLSAADEHIGIVSSINIEAVIPLAPFIGDQFILMQDNARPHTARIVTEYLEQVGITVLDWLTRTPDMNPIDHLWDNLGRHRNSVCRSRLHELAIKVFIRTCNSHSNPLVCHLSSHHHPDHPPRRLKSASGLAIFSLLKRVANPREDLGSVLITG
uniref:Tc1-like transposase DDE domain-containing protein n=1 Tax=Rhodnius prolixus TaxID=13249 RepID=T1IAY8_RHOPR